MCADVQTSRFVARYKFIVSFLAKFDSGLEGIKDNEVISSFVKMGM